jgi:hypothetical protein
VTLAVAVVVLLLAGVSVLAWPLVFRPAATSTGGEVYREATSTPGRDPFSGTVVLGNPPGAKSQTPIDAAAGTVRTIGGDVQALYGGSRNEHVCDRQKLVTFLQQNPDKATAWAGVLGISTTDIPTYIATLTPLQLRVDTRVTNHGFVDGHATSLQSVLQAGTVVLADDHGRPRVKCGCGNPLLDPVATPITPVYTGDDWPDFSPRNVSAVTPAAVQVDRFVVYDLRTGDTFYRPRGTDVSGDGFTAITPNRVLDSRSGPTHVGEWATPIGPGVPNVREVTIGGTPGVPADADAVVLNVTVVNPTAGSFLQLWPKDAPQPTYGSSLNYNPGQIVPNQVTVKLGTGGKVSVYNAQGNVNVIIDVFGYYQSGTGDAFHAVVPGRVLDSRSGPTNVGDFASPWGAGVPNIRDVIVGGRANVPTDASGVVMNVTVVGASAGSSPN